jgi:hypothetical protein
MKKLLIYSAIVLFIGLSINYFRSNAQSSELIPEPCDDINLPCPFPTPQVISVVFEQVNSTLDCNPKFGSPALCDGKRIFPDKDNPNDMLNKKIVKVTATLNIPTNLAKIAFKTFDVDDPDTNMIIDPNGVLGDDNKGTPKSGTLSFYSTSPGSSDNIVVGTDENGKASVYLTATMQPGDNFVVAASAGSSYLESVTVNGTGLKHITDGPLPNSKAKITEMLTVWRRLHIEVDNMAQVPKGNRVQGTFPFSGVLNPNVLTGGVPVTPTSPSSALEFGRFFRGRIISGQNDLEVSDNDGANNLRIWNRTNQPIQINQGDKFTLYDDDDYNNNNATALVGDVGEAIIASSNIFPDLNAPLSDAYIVSERQWAIDKMYNQSNVPFDLNIDTTNQAGLSTLANTYRGSASDEREDFWIAYFIIGYQGDNNSDFDGFTSCMGINCVSEVPLFAFTIRENTIHCDCLRTQTQVSPCLTSNICSVVPKGGTASVILQEVIRDQAKHFLPRIIKVDRTIVAHELGHQFGLQGDQYNSLILKIMDYPNYDSMDGSEVGFHPEHVNIMRSRVKSPGVQ